MHFRASTGIMNEAVRMHWGFDGMSVCFEHVHFSVLLHEGLLFCLSLARVVERGSTRSLCVLVHTSSPV